MRANRGRLRSIKYATGDPHCVPEDLPYAEKETRLDSGVEFAMGGAA
jgi:hypothetical protein